MNLPEIWDTDLFPLAPITRPRDIPADHSVDVWVFLSFSSLSHRVTTTGRTTLFRVPPTILARMKKPPTMPLRITPAKSVRILESSKTWILVSSSAPPSSSSPSSLPRSPPSRPTLRPLEVPSRNSVQSST